MENKMNNTEEQYKEDVIEKKETSVQPADEPTIQLNAEATLESAVHSGTQPALQHEVAEKAASWGEKNVTRKFLAIALALALALNIALTAGVTKLLSPHKGFDKGRIGRSGNEQQFDNNRGGRNNMMPPSGNQQPGQPGQQPGGQQIQPNQQGQQPDGQPNQQDQKSDDQQNQQDQKSDDKSSSENKNA